MAVKKTAAAKKKSAAAKKTPAKRGRPPKKVATPAKKKPGSGRGGANRPVNPDTGFVEGTDQDIIALALLEGGESRHDVAERVASQIETETRNGTEKQVVNMVSGVLNKMLARGFTVESTFVVLPPTPASKRAATKKATQKPAPVAKKTAAKKTASGKRRGRPPGSKNKPKTGAAARKSK